MGPALTPVAGYEECLVAANLLKGHHTTADCFSAKLQDTASWYSSRRLGEDASAGKVLVEEKTGRILGAHLLGPPADEVINLFALAIRAGVIADAFKTMIWAYPTTGSDTAYMV